MQNEFSSPDRLQENDGDDFAQEEKRLPEIDDGHCSETSISWRKRQDGKSLSIYFTDRLKMLTGQ